MFTSTVKTKYKIKIIAKNPVHEYNTTLELWKEDDKVYAYINSNNPKTDLTHIFKDTDWLDATTSEAPHEVDLDIEFDFTPSFHGSYEEPAHDAEVSPYKAIITFKSMKLDVTDLLKIKLNNGKTYGDSLHDEMAENAMDTLTPRDEE